MYILPSIVSGLLVAVCGTHLALLTGFFPRLTALLFSAVGAFLGFRALRTSFASKTACTTARDPLVLICSTLLGLTCLHVLFFRDVGWDGASYHTAKAALFAQKGGMYTFSAPGAWERYDLFPALGSVFQSIPMLLLNNVSLWILADVFSFLLLGLSVYALAKCLRRSQMESLTCALFLLCLPVVQHSVGSGYVDNLCSALILSATCFSLFAHRHARYGMYLLCGLCLGAAYAVKPSSLASIGLLLVSLLLLLAVGSSENLTKRVLAAFCVLFGALFPMAPWLYRSAQISGYPLSPLDLSIFSIRLGNPTSASIWYQTQLELKFHQIYHELEALSGNFLFPAPPFPSLSLFSIFLLPFMAIGLFVTLKQRGKEGLLLAAPVVGALIFYFHPGFQVVRYWLHGSNSRFLIVPFAVALICAFECSFLKNRFKPLFLKALLGIAIIHSLTPIMEPINVPPPLAEQYLVCALISIIIYLIYRLIVRFTSGIAKSFCLVLLSLVLLSLAGVYRMEQSYLASFAPRSFAGFQPVPAYIPYLAGRVTDLAPGKSRIAVTSGSNIKFDNFQFYHFLGKHLENQIFYIPISEDGQYVSFFPKETRIKGGHFDTWLNRLRASQIQFVVSFYPRSVEIQWMLSNPHLFEPIRVKDSEEFGWGLFRVLPSIEP